MKLAVFHRVFTIFTLASISFFALGQTPQVEIDTVPSWVETADIQTIDSTRSEGGVGYMLIDNQIDIRSAEKQQYSRYAYQILTQQGLTHAPQIEVVFSGNFEQLIFHSIDVVREGKVVSRLDTNSFKVFQKESELKDNIYSENWTALVILEDVRVGDVIDYSYTIVGSNPVLGNKHFGKHGLNWTETSRDRSF